MRPYGMRGLVYLSMISLFQYKMSLKADRISNEK
jgi:hypothetical protein